MKNLLALLVCFGIVIGLSTIVGCGDDKKPAATDKKPATDKKEDEKKKP